MPFVLQVPLGYVRICQNMHFFLQFLSKLLNINMSDPKVYISFPYSTSKVSALEPRFIWMFGHVLLLVYLILISQPA